MSRFVVALGLAFVLVFAGSSFADDSKVSPKWDYDLGSRVNSIAVGDLGNGATELVVASDKGIFVFSGDGSVIRNYSVSFTPSVVYISQGKILVGSGDFKTTNITNPIFNFSDKDNIVQIPSVVYKTVRNLGDVYIISGNNTPKLFLPSGGWVRNIYAGDVNADSSTNYAVVTGGLSIDFIKTARLEDSPRELVRSSRLYSDYDQCEDLVKVYKSGLSSSTITCTFMEGQNYMDVWVTPGVPNLPHSHLILKSNDDQCSELTNMLKSYFANMTVTCDFNRLASSMGGGGRRTYYSGYMEVNYTQPPRFPQIWVYENLEIDSTNGSLLLFSSNGSVLINKTFSAVPEYVSLVSFSSNTSKMLSFGSEPINLTDISGNLVYSYDSPEENYTVKALFMDSIRGEKLNDIVAGFSANKVSGVFVLDRDGKMVWVYKVSSEDFKGLYYYDIDSDTSKEIILATNKGVYAIGNDGNLKMSFNFEKSIDKLAVGDIDGNGYMDFAVASGQKAYVYEIDETFIKSGLANRYYINAQDSLSLGNYDTALLSVQKAVSLYKNLSDEAGLGMSESLLSDIKENMKGIKNETAASLYKKGRTEFYLGNYTQSREYLEKALEVYTDIGNAEGILKTKNAIADVDSMNSTGTITTTTSPVVETTPTTNSPGTEPPTDVSQYILLLVGVILVFLLVIIVKLLSGGRGGPKEEPKENDVIQSS